MSLLTWHKAENGTEMAEANGFKYICADNSDKPNIFAELIVEFNGAQVSCDKYDQQSNAGYRKQKRVAELHALAISHAIEQAIKDYGA